MTFFETSEGLAKRVSSAMFAAKSGKVVAVCVGKRGEPSEAVVEGERL
jgi:hypothetical protein